MSRAYVRLGHNWDLLSCLHSPTPFFPHMVPPPFPRRLQLSAFILCFSLLPLTIADQFCLFIVSTGVQRVRAPRSFQKSPRKENSFGRKQIPNQQSGKAPPYQRGRFGSIMCIYERWTIERITSFDVESPKHFPHSHTLFSPETQFHFPFILLAFI